MKTPRFEKIIAKAGRQVELSAAERDQMRSVLRAHMALNPRETSERTAAAAYQAFIDAFVAYVRQPAFALAALILMFAVSGGSVVYAAEGSLPGDALYPVKVSAIEPLRTALTFSPVAKASWQQTLAERRLDEAVALAGEGKLSSTTEQTLAVSFAEHANAAITAVANTPQTAPEQDDVASVDFSARLSAYEQVLAAAGGEDRASTTLALRDKVRSQISLIASTTPAHSLNATHLQKAARAALVDSADLLSSVTDTLTATGSKGAQGSFDEAQKLETRGTDLLKQDDAAGASKAFQDSLSASARLDVFTHAAAALNVDVFSHTAASSTPAASSTSDRTGHDRSRGHEDGSSSDTAPTAASTTSATTTIDLPTGATTTSEGVHASSSDAKGTQEDSSSILPPVFVSPPAVHAPLSGLIKST